MSKIGDHIKPLRLFDLARESGLPASDQEKEHLRECEECQRIVEVFARQFNKSFRPPPGKPKDGTAA